MGKWEMVRLRDVCEFINGDRGVNYPSANDFCASGIPFINAGHLKNEAISFDDMNYISKQKYDELGSGKIQNGDLLYCLRGSLGKQAVVSSIEKGAIASSLVIIRPFGVNIGFLRYCMKTNMVAEQQLKANNGSSQPNLSAANVKNFVIPLPPLEVQRKIADILDRANALIEKRKTQIDKLDLLVKSQFVKMFGDPVTNPKGWEVKPLSDVIIHANNGMARRGNNTDGNIVLRLVELQDGYINYAMPNRIMLDEAEKSRYKLEDGDFLFARVNGNPEYVGRCAVFTDIGEVVYHNDHIIRVRFNEQKLAGAFASELFNSSYGKREMKAEIKTSAGQYTINQNGIGSIKVPLPPLALQTQFAAFVERVEAQRARMKKGLELMELEYKSLMQKCFEEDEYNGCFH